MNVAKNLLTFKNINKKRSLMYPSNKNIYFLNWNHKRCKVAEVGEVISEFAEIWIVAFLLFFGKLTS